MKVFSWMHWRFHHAHSCNTHLQDHGLEKDATSKVDVEKHASLEDGSKQVLVGVINDWNEGILSIGTLAIGPLETETYEIIKEVQDHHDGENNHDHQDIHDDDDDDDAMHVNDDDQNLKDKNDDLDGCPLMKRAVFNHELGKVDVVDTCNEIEEVCEENVTSKDNTNGMTSDNNNGCQIRRRVTLADLFSEDSDHHLVNKLREIDVVVASTPASIPAPNNIISNINMKLPNPEKVIKPTLRTKNGLSKAKKLLKDEFRSIKKLNQLMRRMMKKKIHPDLEGKMQKKDIQMQSINGTNESRPLLLIQDPVV